MDKVIEKFSGFFLYKTELVGDNFEVKRRKIKVIQEQILSGAIRPTYTVEEDGRKFYIGKDSLYRQTSKEADEDLMSDITKAVIDAGNDIVILQTKIRNLVSALTELIKTGSEGVQHGKDV